MALAFAVALIATGINRPMLSTSPTFTSQAKQIVTR